MSPLISQAGKLNPNLLMNKMMNNALGSYKGAFLIFIVSLFRLISIADAQELTGKDILSVEIFYTEGKAVDKAHILDLMSVKPGQKFSPENLNNDVSSLIDSGVVDDVRMYGEEQGSGVNVIVKVLTRPMLAGVRFEGNTAFSNKQLAKKSELKRGALISDSSIFLALEKLSEYYHDYDYPNNVISHRIQMTDDPDYADLIFTIDEGQNLKTPDAPDLVSSIEEDQKTKVLFIRFIGNNSFKSTKLKDVMRTKEKGVFSFLTKSGDIDVIHLKEDEQSILNFYRERGYLAVKSSGFQRVVDSKGQAHLLMTIDEGIKYQVNQVVFGGKMTVFTSEYLTPILRMNAGVPLSLDKVRGDIRTIRSYYGSRGYADASVQPDISDAGPGLINLTYIITEGKPYKVGRVIIEGNNQTLDRVIRREVPLKPNDNLNTVDVETTRQRLLGLNYFSNVMTEERTSEQKGYRDIIIKVDEKNTGKMNLTIGFSSIDYLVGYVSVEETNFDISDPWNFRGAGQRFGLNLRLSSENQDFSLRYTEPWFLGRRLSLGTEIFYRGAQNLSDYYDQRNVGVAVSLRKALGNRSRINASLSYEKIRINAKNNLPKDSLFNSADGHYNRPALSLFYEYDGRDAVQTTRRGSKFEAGVTSVFKALNAENDTFIFNIAGLKYWNLWFDSILELSGEVATMETNGGSTPIYDRQFLGGYRNLRGFGYRDVGPRDSATGGVIGGDSMATAAIEWTIPLISNMRGAVFYEAGFVNLESWDFSPSDYYSDAGMGLRMKLPFGPLALDYAFPLNAPDAKADKGAHFNFYINYDF